MSDTPGLIGRHRVGVRATPLGRAELPAFRRPFEERPAESETSLVPKTAEELRLDGEESRDAQPMDTACAWCEWTFTGTAGECRDAAAVHREAAHPDAQNRLGRRRSHPKPKYQRTEAENAQVSVEAAEARRVRAEREDADRLAKIERGRQRDALDKLDAGLPQDREEEPEAHSLDVEPPEPQPDGSPPPRDESNDDEETTMKTVAERLGLKKFGRGYIWTREAMIEAVRAYAAEHGEPPTQEDAKRAPLGMLPSTKSIGSEFADWNDLVGAAGFTPSARGATRSGREPKASAEEPAAGSVAVSPPAAATAEAASRPEHHPEIALRENALRDPLRTADVPYDADILEDEAEFLRRRADALDLLASGVRALAA